VYKIDVAKKSWTRPSIKGVQPSPRECHSAALDNVKNRIIFYGGSRLSSQNLKIDRFDEIIVLQLTTQSWFYPVAVGIVPQGRAGHSSCVLDEKMYILGGTVRG
jgi:F-box protein 42